MSDNTFIKAENDPNRVDERFQLDFPSRMNDGRQLADYRSSCLYNLAEQDMTTYQYRLYLKHNTDQIMQNYRNMNDYISNPNWEQDKCKSCSDRMIASAYLPTTCSSFNKNDVNIDSGVGDYFVNNH